MHGPKAFVAAVALVCWATLLRALAADERFVDSLERDNECGALDDEGQPSRCALNALQRQSSRQTADSESSRMGVDLESSEGADRVEAVREWYASEGGEHEGHNRTTQLLGARSGIWPPRSAFQYNGMSWPEITTSAGEEHHFFAIGDWGGMDGELIPPDGFPRMITYEGGHLPGPHVFPRSRLLCHQASLTACFFKGKHCKSTCGFAAGVDDKAQLLVANQMIKRAAAHDPQFVLNVGDNFYWGGIAKRCGHPMNNIHSATRHQFDTIFEQVYKGPGLDGKPWLSVLGNHDWGGRMFTAGWDQQIAYTWASRRWLMPAAYWHQRVKFPSYTADIYMVDTNHNDAHPEHQHKETNICGQFNGDGASCASSGGPKSIAECVDWFQSLWAEEQVWLEKGLTRSDADWQIVVTHFPCDSTPGFWRKMHGRHGLDLLVTGHRHDQELHKAHRSVLGGLTCFVTGGGGGITSEESVLHGTPTHLRPHVGSQYGFFDMTITKATIKVESIDYMGVVVDSTTVYPRA